MKKIVALLLTLFFITSCSTNYHVFVTDSTNTKLDKDEFFTFENDTIVVKYNFQSEYGIMSFAIFNKINKPLYLDWKKSSLVLNGKKLTYWREAEISTSSSTIKQYTYKGDQQENILAKSIGVSLAADYSEKPERITFLPPRSYMFKVFYYLQPQEDYQLLPSKSTEKSTVLNGKSYNYLDYSFEYENSILKFRNFVTYSLDEKFTEEFYIDNEFFVKNILEMEADQLFPKASKYDLGVPSELFTGRNYTNPYLFFRKTDR